MKYRRINRDLNKRQLFKKTELFQKIIKSMLLFSSTISLTYVVNNIFFFKVLVNAFKTRIRNYCTVSGRVRGIYRKVKVSRIVLRDLGGSGLFFGLKKAS